MPVAMTRATAGPMSTTSTRCMSGVIPVVDIPRKMNDATLNQSTPNASGR